MCSLTALQLGGLEENETKLRELVNAANGTTGTAGAAGAAAAGEDMSSDHHSHGRLLSNILVTSPILQGGGGRECIGGAATGGA